MEEPDKINTKKQKILDAAFGTIYENTIAGTNLREIAKRAGMSQGNLHYYYPVKSELLIDLLDRLLENFINERKSIVADTNKNPSEKLFLLINQEKKHVKRKKEMNVFMDFCIHGANNAVIQQKVRKTYNTWLNLIQEVIDEGIKDDTFSSKYQKLFPNLFISLADGASLRYLTNGSMFDLNTFFSSIHTLCLSMLTPENEPKY